MLLSKSTWLPADIIVRKFITYDMYMISNQTTFPVILLTGMDWPPYCEIIWQIIATGSVVYLRISW